MLLFIVAFTGGLRILFIFTSFSRLPLGDSTTILFSSPVIVMVLSMFILHERCGIFRMVAATTLLGGVILISKPPFIFGQDENLGYDAIGIWNSETLQNLYLFLFIFPHFVLSMWKVEFIHFAKDCCSWQSVIFRIQSCTLRLRNVCARNSSNKIDFKAGKESDGK